ncbi:MAG TPA: UvrD-helicase domain-containing protein [Candidatus Polarisedimenticolia bacterium]|nr:UvrD-helicase domain-containing protein [Candidatus Polarisedimenticolia bacterium]
MNDLLNDLSPSQREAVETTEGPVLVIAGAGSGKTRVLTYRVAWLLGSLGVPPAHIVAVTFTNKAAAEMRDRMAPLIGADPADLRMGTFHSLCLRILRREAGRLGYPPRFAVYDTSDQVAVMKEVAVDLRLDTTQHPPRALLHRISAVRNRHVTPEEIASALTEGGAYPIGAAYEAYIGKLKAAGAMDFDDLILNVLRLFEKHPDVRLRCQETTRYLLVDEFQDTNRPQYLLLRTLIAGTRNLCVVGDDAQSIYRFRGAEIGNILRFCEDYPDAPTIKLTRNYRSTGRILAAAGNVIRKNLGRIEKELWTENPEGDLITYLQAETDRDEAVFVAEQILALKRAGGLDLGDIGVLYRTNAQSRLLEEALVNARLAYRIFGGLRFYDRKEIKDLLAYLRLALNPADDVSMRRIINVPQRGVGRQTLDVLEEAAGAEGISLFESARRESEKSPPSRSSRALKGLVDLLAQMGERAEASEPVSRILTALVDRLDYTAYLQRNEPGDAESRIENVQQLVAAAQEQESAGGSDLQAFLDGAALVSDAESVTGDTGVNLMTVHCAKGLEFPVVFIAGMEENLFPHTRSVTAADPEEIEEERRLCYVGMTRAKTRLVLSCARQRRAFGTMVSDEPSRFISEVGPGLLNDLTPDWMSARSYDRPGPPRWTRGPSAPRNETSLGDEDVSVHPDDDAPAASVSLRAGMRVYHKQFGYGEVETIEGSGEKQKATVRFSGWGRKKLMTHYAKLQRVTG